MEPLDFKKEHSAGCVVYKRENADAKKTKIKFLLSKHSGYHKWVLPKGLIEKGEESWQTAIRETKEETGVDVKLVDKKPIHQIQYFYTASYKERIDNTRRVKKYQEEGGSKTKVFKIVDFYLAEYLDGNPKNHGWEMEKAGWFSFDEASKKLAFPGEKEVLKKAYKMLTSEI